ncbi:hypothetical protein BGZ73_005440 [Actinomortierella ambigua]|nr:hypothetical protein BGZ73_005440 [Actinomortierella ambigua]
MPREHSSFIASGQPTLPMDCIYAVTNHVHDPCTLFSLLTVAKDVSIMAVRKLYSNPFQLALSPESIRLLYQLILCLSPARDRHVEEARAHFKIDWDQLIGQGRPKPYIDYLQFIRHVVFPEPPNLMYYSVSAEVNDLTDMQSTIVWAVCGHRLSEVRSLQITPASAWRYESLIQHMTSLNTIVWAHLWARDYPYPIVPQFNKAAVLARNRAMASSGGSSNTSTSTTFTSGRDTRPLRITFPRDWPSYHPTVIWWEGIMNSSTTQNDFLVLTPENVHRYLELMENGKHDSVDASVVRAIDFALRGDALASKVYSHLSRFRNLESFVGDIAGESNRLFQWAAEERREWLAVSAKEDIMDDGYASSTTSCHPPLPAPHPPWLPPLKMVNIGCYGFQLEQTVKDLTDAFGNTLEWIWIRVVDRSDDDTNNSFPRSTIARVGAQWNMPALRRFYLYSKSDPSWLRLDPRAFAHSPLMEVISVKDSWQEVDLSMATDSHLSPRLSQRTEGDHDAGSTPFAAAAAAATPGVIPTMATTATSPLDAPTIPPTVFHLSEVWHMQHLRELKLYSAPAAEFNPDSFHWMPMLEHAHIGLRSMPPPAYTSFSGVTTYRTHLFQWPRERWTWTWRLPRLTHLTLEGCVATTFRFQAMHHCLPSLDTLWLDPEDHPAKLELAVAKDKDDRRNGDEGEKEEQTLDETNGMHRHHSHDRDTTTTTTTTTTADPATTPQKHTLRMVTLEGSWEMMDDDQIEALMDPTVFVRLEQIRLRSMPWDDVRLSLLQAIVRMGKRHPRIQTVMIHQLHEDEYDDVQDLLDAQHDVHDEQDEVVETSLGGQRYFGLPSPRPAWDQSSLQLVIYGRAYRFEKDV